MENIFDPSKIRLLLNFEGWSFSDLATRSGLSRNRLSSIAKAEREFDEETAQTLSFASGFPLSFFMVSEPILDEESMTFRKSASTRKRNTRRSAAEYSMVSDSASRLIAMAHAPARTSWIDDLSPLESPSASDVEHLGVEARRLLGIAETGPVPNVMWSLESGGVVVTPLTSQSRDGGGKAEGVSSPGASSVPVIGYAAHDAPGDRLRFTIAHEMGHLLLHRHRLPPVGKVTEAEAHGFAGAFLIPETDMREAVSPRSNLKDLAYVKAGWGVAISALITRAARLGIFDSDRQRSLMMQMSARSWTRHEPVKVEVEHPVYFKQLLGNVFGTIVTPSKVQVSRRSAVEFLGRPFELLNTWADGIEEKPEDLEMSGLV